MRAIWCIAILLTLTLSGCARHPDPLAPLVVGDVELAPLASGLDKPIYATQGPDGAYYAVSQSGHIDRFMDNDTRSRWLDLDDIVEDDAFEQGLLGFAFHPDEGSIFVFYTGEDEDGDSVLARIPLRDGTPVVDALEILFVEPQPEDEHQAGMLMFGPDGLLYVSLGDGGGSNDRNNNGQDRTDRKGTILRIDVSGAPGSGYTIPADNPYADGGPNGDWQPEIWMYGLRNPWRFSIDNVTGDIWIGDVGQREWEEINHVPAGQQAGANLGWPRYEGTHDFRKKVEAEGAIMPVHDFPHEGSKCSVTGGFVYRGDDIPHLAGQYVFGDWCSGSIWAMDTETYQVGLLMETGFRVSSFGQALDGELLVVAHAGEPEGAVYQLVGRA